MEGDSRVTQIIVDIPREQLHKDSVSVSYTDKIGEIGFEKLFGMIPRNGEYTVFVSKKYGERTFFGVVDGNRPSDLETAVRKDNKLLGNLISGWATLNKAKNKSKDIKIGKITFLKFSDDIKRREKVLNNLLTNVGKEKLTKVIEVIWDYEDDKSDVVRVDVGEVLS